MAKSKEYIVESYCDISKGSDFNKYTMNTLMNQSIRDSFTFDRDFQNQDHTSDKASLINDLYRTRLSCYWDSCVYIEEKNLRSIFSIILRDRKKFCELLKSTQFDVINDNGEHVKQSILALCKMTIDAFNEINERQIKSLGPISFWTKFAFFHHGKIFIYDKHSRNGASYLIEENARQIDLDKFLEFCKKIWNMLYGDEELCFERTKNFDAFLSISGLDATRDFRMAAEQRRIQKSIQRRNEKTSKAA